MLKLFFFNIVIELSTSRPKRSIVLTEIYSKFAKQLIQIAGPKNIQHKTEECFGQKELKERDSYSDT